MSTKQTSFGLLLFVLLVGLGAVPVPAATPDIEAASQTCPQFPEVDYWINDPAKIVRTISRSYRGSWERYIDRWKAYQEKMVRISEAEGFAIIKSRAIRLEGDLLKQHIEDVKKRIEVLSCLQTKLGGKPKKKKKRRIKRKKKGVPQEAMLKTDDMTLDIKATCEKDAAVFKIINLGEKWPRLGAFHIYRTKGKKLRLKRSLRLAKNQIATFRIKGKRNKGQLGLWVAPSWAKRKFRYDLRIYCR